MTTSTLGDRYRDCDEVARRLRDELDDDPEGTLFFSTDPRLDVLLPDRCALPQKLVAAIMHRRGVVDYSDFARSVAVGRVKYCVTYTPDRPSQDLAGAVRAFAVAQHDVDPGPGRAAFVGASFDRFRPLFRVGAFTVYAGPRGADRAGRDAEASWDIAPILFEMTSLRRQRVQRQRRSRDREFSTEPTRRPNDGIERVAWITNRLLDQSVRGRCGGCHAKRPYLLRWKRGFGTFRASCRKSSDGG